MIQQIFELFRSGAAIPYILLAILVAGWVVAVERFILLQLFYRIDFKKFNSTIRKMLAAADFGRAKKYCKASGNTGVPLIVTKAIQQYENDVSQVRQIMSEEIMIWMPRVRRRISQLPNLATAAVLVGAASSVNGIWIAFRSAETLELGVKNFAFSEGLTHAMVPLALSLVICMLLMFSYGVLDAIAGRLEADSEHSLTIVSNILAPENFVATTAIPMAAGVPTAQPAAASPKPDTSEPQDKPPAVEESVDDQEIMEDLSDEEEII